MRLRKFEEEELHGPWPDMPPGPDEVALDAFREEFGGHWRIWRSMDQGKVPGEWCARRITNEAGCLRSVSADTADDLRDTLRGDPSDEHDDSPLCRFPCRVGPVGA